MQVLMKIILTTFFFTLLFNGCARKLSTYDVFNNHIKSANEPINYYKCMDAGPNTSVRIVGVYENTKENRKMVEDALNNVVSEFQSVDNLKTVKKTRDYDRSIQICKDNIALGNYGYYKNMVEYEQLFSSCMNKEMYKDEVFYTGAKTNISKSKPTSADIANINITSKSGDGSTKLYYSSTTIIGKILSNSNKIVIFYKIHGDDVDTVYLTNKLLLEEIKIQNLPQTEKAIMTNENLCRYLQINQ